jgi:hypothetical protein
MGLAFNVDVKEISNKAILDAATTPVTTATVKGTVTGTGTAGLAVAHLGSNNMIAFRYRLKNVRCGSPRSRSPRTASPSLPAHSSSPDRPSDLAAAKAAVESLGLTAADAHRHAGRQHARRRRAARRDLLAVAGTQELGWYRHAFDQFGIPFDLIYKERVVKGNLKADYDVIVMAAQNITKTA